MSGISGLSALLTISLVTLVVMQLAKGQMDVFENYGDTVPYSYVDKPATNNKINPETKIDLPVLQNLQVENKHGFNDFGTGTMFRAPSIDYMTNRQWSTQPNQLLIDQANIAAATPTEQQLRIIGAIPENLTNAPFAFNEGLGPTVQQNDLSLCSQNMNALSVSPNLLPVAPDSFSAFSNQARKNSEGFADTSSDNNVACNNMLMMDDQKFLAPRSQIGSDMVGASLRNANLQVRSDPPCPVKIVSPWMNSTIGPDLTRRPLEENSSNFGMYGNGFTGQTNPVAINMGPQNRQ